MTFAPLSSASLLRMWEGAEAAVSAEARALLVLSVACPEEGWESLAEISIGRRDQRLLELRERLMGARLIVCGECSNCQEPVEIALDTRDLGAAAAGVDTAAGTPAALHRLEHGDMVIEFRLPSSVDLEAVSLCEDVETARGLLLDRCVVSAVGADGSQLNGSELPPEVQRALDVEMDRLDPLAVMEVGLRCPACGHRWQARLDISEVVLSELATQARLIMQEVATLATHYHWSEESILEMSSRRRRGYLELVGA